jgi:hypothetical protein
MEGEGEGFYVQRPMEGEKEGFYARRLMEGERKGFYVRRPMEGEGEDFFSPLPTSPQATLFIPSFFSFDIKVLLYHDSRLLCTQFFYFPWPINYNRAF